MNTQIAFPSENLLPYVKHYEFYEFTNEKPLPESFLFMPSFVNGFLFCFCRDRPVMLRTGDQTKGQALPKCSLLAAVCRPSELSEICQLRAIRVVFQPGALATIYDFPHSKFAGKSVDLVKDVDKAIVTLWGNLLIENDHKRQVNLIERYLRKRITTRSPEHNLYHVLSSYFSQSGYSRKVSEVAKKIGFGERHFNRLLCNQLGVSTSRVGHIHRFNRALKMLRNNPNLPITDVAYDLDYAHPGHFCREFKAFSSLTPSQYASGVKSGHYILPDSVLDVDKTGVLYRMN